jgi:predicted dehydrogenase/threonine dehydrogenase-like Zn-dependent dehydrogenase
MLQALVKKGKVTPVSVPSPIVTSGSVLIKVVNSCISAGTELTSVSSSKKSLIRRAMEQPQQVTRVYAMVRDVGIEKTISKIKERVNTGSPTGYSISGVVLGVGEGVTDIQIGDRVAAAGAGIANHAEFVDVPRNLVMRIPDTLDFEAASTVTLGGIALQGVRRADVKLGEIVVVLGAGILGQLAIQLLSVSGARVIAVDIDDKRLDTARQRGALECINSSEQYPASIVRHFSDGYGADAVLFCAATAQEQVLSQAFAMTRKKGRVVMVGVYGDVLHRSDIYRKEIDFLISTSYGPGRYDPQYEEKGLDYPYAYVRWTENRNMEVYLHLLDEKKVTVDPLIDKIYPIAKVGEAFESLGGPEKPLMVLLDYGIESSKAIEQIKNLDHKITIQTKPLSKKRNFITVGLIGAGNFAKSTHLPNLYALRNKYQIRAICDKNGANAQGLAQHYKAAYSTTDYHELLQDPDIDLVMICTRHHLHGPMVLESLKVNKHTFVEKPLCTQREELDAIKAFYDTDTDKQKPILTVGFNRRFSKYAREIKKHVDKRINPLFIHYRMNAGYIPLDHWVHSEEGGGRIIGEACHIIDLFSYLINSPVQSICAGSLFPNTTSIQEQDNKSIVLEYADGSVAHLDYFAVGSKELEKEYLEVHFDEKSIVLNNFQELKGYGIKVKHIHDKSPDKGSLSELESLYDVLRTRKDQWPIPLEQILETTKLTFELQNSNSRNCS